MWGPAGLTFGRARWGAPELPSGERDRRKAAERAVRNRSSVEAGQGGLAQLGERRVRNAEVEGSNPLPSTKRYAWLCECLPVA